MVDGGQILRTTVSGEYVPTGDLHDGFQVLEKKHHVYSYQHGPYLYWTNDYGGRWAIAIHDPNVESGDRQNLLAVQGCLSEHDFNGREHERHNIMESCPYSDNSDDDSDEHSHEHLDEPCCSVETGDIRLPDDGTARNVAARSGASVPLNSRWTKMVDRWTWSPANVAITGAQMFLLFLVDAFSA